MIVPPTLLYFIEIKHNKFVQQAFHAGNTGSNPVADAKAEHRAAARFFIPVFLFLCPIPG